MRLWHHSADEERHPVIEAAAAEAVELLTAELDAPEEVVAEAQRRIHRLKELEHGPGRR